MAYCFMKQIAGISVTVILNETVAMIYRWLLAGFVLIAIFEPDLDCCGQRPKPIAVTGKIL